MREEKFRVIQYIRELLLAIDKDMANFPKKDIELKNRIRNNTYDILEVAYEANVTTDIHDKRKLLFQVIAKLKVIDFLLNLSYDKKLITEKRYYGFGRRIDDIVKYTSGWLKTLI